MILESARVENYKSVEDSTEFSVRGLTCLVGKNESGKTALLRALYRTNPIISGEGDFFELEYPRRKWARYRQRKNTSPDRVVTTVWRLEEQDQQALSEVLGPGVLTSDTVTVTKGYDNELTWQIDLDERAVVTHIARSALVDAEELRPLWSARTIPALIEALRAIEGPTPLQKALLKDVQQAFADTSAQGVAVDILTTRLPKFLYFADYHRLPGTVSVDDLIKKRQTNRVSITDAIFFALLDLAHVTLDDLKEMGQFEYLIAELESVSDRVTKEVLEYWSQDRDLEVEFRCDAARPKDPAPFNTGHVVRTRIRNRRHNVTLPFDERSSGFIWFFSFLIWLSSLRKQQGSDYVVLLDEPGLSLHARGQMDLLRFVKERIQPHYQVLFSTHSPFMIDGDDLMSIRTVEDMTENGIVKGTKVGDRTLSKDADTVFPIRAVLAYDAARGSLLGEHTLLVDRPGDVLYLKWFSRELQLQGRDHLDASWTIVPGGGLDKLASFSNLFAGPDFTVAVFTNGVVSDRERLQALRDKGLLSLGRVLKASIYVDQEDADVEDLIGRALYITLVHACYGLNEATSLPAERPADAPACVTAEVARHFTSLPPWTPRYDPYGPAAFLVENAATLRSMLSPMDDALARFENVFRDLNSLL